MIKLFFEKLELEESSGRNGCASNTETSANLSHARLDCQRFLPGRSGKDGQH